MFTELPLYSIRPWVTALTRGVLNQMPGSVGLPKLAILVPKRRSVDVATGVTAAARSCSVVVSKSSTVRAVDGGGGGKSGRVWFKSSDGLMGGANSGPRDGDKSGTTIPARTLPPQGQQQLQHISSCFKPMRPPKACRGGKTTAFVLARPPART